MDWGMKNRLSRIIPPETGHTVMLPVDHGYFQGPIARLEEPEETLKPLLPYADAVMLTRGILRNCLEAVNQTPIVLRVSGGTSMAGKDLSDEGITTSMKEALRLNASAVALSIYVGSDHEKETLLNLARLVDEGQEYGMPVLAVTAVGRELEKREARFLALCCRIAAELGAQFVKTYYCHDFSKVVRGCPVPLVVAGGPRMETDRDVLELTYNAIQEGATGVDMGRNVFQSDFPVAMLRALRAMVQEKASLKEAWDMFQALKAKELEPIGKK